MDVHEKLGKKLGKKSRNRYLASVGDAAAPRTGGATQKKCGRGILRSIAFRWPSSSLSASVWVKKKQKAQLEEWRGGTP